MSLLTYFKVAKQTLPKPDGPLSTTVPSSSIAAANKEVKQLLDQARDDHETTSTSKRGTYQRADGRYTSRNMTNNDTSVNHDNGVRIVCVATLLLARQNLSDCRLPDSSVDVISTNDGLYGVSVHLPSSTVDKL